MRSNSKIVVDSGYSGVEARARARSAAVHVHCARVFSRQNANTASLKVLCRRHVLWKTITSYYQYLLKKCMHMWTAYRAKRVSRTFLWYNFVEQMIVCVTYGDAVAGDDQQPV